MAAAETVGTVFKAVCALLQEYDELKQRDDVIEEMTRVIRAVHDRETALRKIEANVSWPDMRLRMGSLMQDLASRVQECRDCLARDKSPTYWDRLRTFENRNKKIKDTMHKLAATNSRLTDFMTDLSVLQQIGSASPRIAPQQDLCDQVCFHALLGAFSLRYHHCRSFVQKGTIWRTLLAKMGSE
jgi:hypothetical protein